MPSHTEEERRKKGALNIAGEGKLDMPSRPVAVAPGPVPGKGKYDYPTGMRPGEETLSSAAPLSSGKMGFPEHMRLKPGAELAPGKLGFPEGMEPRPAAELPIGGEAIDIAKAPVGEWYGEGGFRGIDLPDEQGFMAVTGFDPKSTPFKDISARSAEERRVLAETRFAAGEKAPSMQRAALDSVFPARRQAISSPYEKSIKQLMSRFQKRDFINARERKDVGAVLNALIAQEGAYRRTEMGLPVEEFTAQTGRMTAESSARKREQDLTKLPEQLIPVDIGGTTYNLPPSQAHQYMKKKGKKEGDNIQQKFKNIELRRKTLQGKYDRGGLTEEEFSKSSDLLDKALLEQIASMEKGGRKKPTAEEFYERARADERNVGASDEEIRKEYIRKYGSK